MTTSTPLSNNMDMNLAEMVLLEILERTGITDISEEQHKEYLAKLEPIVDHRIATVLLTSMTPEQKEMYAAADASGAFTLDQLEILLSDPTMEDKVTNELMDIITEFSDIIS